MDRQTYWEIVKKFIEATQERYKNTPDRDDLTQIFMRGPFAGHSEREIAEIVDHWAKNESNMPVNGENKMEETNDID
jgi:hypothetical protein